MPLLYKQYYYVTFHGNNICCIKNIYVLPSIFIHLYFFLVPCNVQTIQNTIKDFHKLLNPNGSTCIKLVEENDPSAPISMFFKDKFDG